MINFQNAILLVVSYIILPKLTFLPRNVHSLIIIFGPFLLTRAISLLSTARAVSNSVPTRPTPPKVFRVLFLLLLCVVTWMVLSLPYFAPENIFIKTQSRLQIEVNTLFTRLGMLRPLTSDDENLRTKFRLSGTNRLLYLAFGPDTLLNCIWCQTADGTNDALNYFYYSLPQILVPHIAHLSVLGFATSSMVGLEGSRFRTHATIVGLLLMVGELWCVGTYDIKQNTKAKVLKEVDFMHWRTRLYRYLAFAIFDAALALLLWTTSTNRWLAKPVSMSERLEIMTKEAEDITNKLRALGLLSNTIIRDPALRGVREVYWRTEGQMMADTVQNEDVARQINRVLEKLDMQGLESRVSQIADGIVSAIDGLQ